MPGFPTLIIYIYIYIIVEKFETSLARRLQDQSKVSAMADANESKYEDQQASAEEDESPGGRLGRDMSETSGDEANPGVGDGKLTNPRLKRAVVKDIEHAERFYRLKNELRRDKRAGAMHNAAIVSVLPAVCKCWL